MGDDVTKCEARLTALRARKTRWQNRYAESEHARGKASERAQCKHNIRRCDEDIAAIERALRMAQVKAAHTGAITTEEISMAARKTELDELRKLAVACDEHARALATAAKELHSKISTHRTANGEIVTSVLRSTIYDLETPERRSPAHERATTLSGASCGVSRLA
jgi:chromosome segregation ATPase